MKIWNGKGSILGFWAADRMQFLETARLLASVSSCLSAGDCPQFLVTQASLVQQLASSKGSSQRMESASKAEVMILCNLITYVTSCPFYHIILLRKESLSQPSSPQQERNTQGCEYPGTGTTERPFK